MKESKSFQDALKRVLVPEQKKKPVPKPIRKKRSNYVSEAMGTSSPTTTTQNGAAQGLPPFSKASADNKQAGVDMRDIGNIESAKAKDHTNKPFPLNHVMDLIAHSGEDLQQAQSMLELTLKKNNVSVSDEQKKILQGAYQALKSSLGNIVKAAQSIDTVNI